MVKTRARVVSEWNTLDWQNLALQNTFWRPYKRHKQCGTVLNGTFGYGAIAGVLDKEWMPALYRVMRLDSSKYYLFMN
jgi:hypothetical protein